MGSRRVFTSFIAAVAISAVIAGPTLAGPPTYTGTVRCALNGEPYDMGRPGDGASSWTRKQINEYYRFYVSADFCDHGSLDLSQMTKGG